MDIVKKHHEQVLQINEIKLNGINLKFKELGKFKIKNNPFVDDHTLSTDLLTLNGDWQLELPFIPLVGTADIKRIQTEIRDEIENCNIACFGCSETRGFFPEDEEAWPYHLGKILNTKVKNFGIDGSNINQITAFIEEYLNSGYKANLIIILIPHTFKRQVKIENKTINVLAYKKKNKELLYYNNKLFLITGDGNLFFIKKTPKKERIFKKIKSNFKDIVEARDETSNKFKLSLNERIKYEKNIFKNILIKSKELFNHGDEHSVATVSGGLEKWVESLSKKAKILIGVYHSNEHNLFKITPLTKVMLPFLNKNDYPKAPDGLHFGKEYCKEYAKTLKNFLIKNSIDY
jgi:hypothetical protein